MVVPLPTFIMLTFLCTRLMQMDDTIARVRSRNNQLREQLREYIEQDSPYKPKQRNLEKEPTEYTRFKGVSTPKLEPQLAPKLAPIDINTPTKPKAKANDTIHRHISKPVPLPEYTKKTSSPNLLLDKVNNQALEIEQLNDIIRELKNKNYALEEEKYQFKQQVEENKADEAKKLSELTGHYEYRIDEYNHQTRQLKEEIDQLRHDSQSKKEQLSHMQSVFENVKLQIISLNTENGKLKQDWIRKSSKLEHFHAYSQVFERLVQSFVVNKFVDKYDELGVLIDLEDGYHDVAEDDTTDLILREPDETKQLLSKKHYDGVNQLIMRNLSLPAANPKVKLRVYIRFIMCVNRFGKINRPAL